MSTNHKTLLFIALALTAILPSCAPVFSDLQSARMAGEGQVEVTPSLSLINYPTEENDLSITSPQGGVQMAFGLSSKVDLRLRYEYTFFTHVIGIGPKFSLIKDRLAFYVPAMIVIGDEEGVDRDITAWQFHPTVLYSYPIKRDKLDFNISGKYIFNENKYIGDSWALNAGFSLSKDLDKWAIRPEVGFLSSAIADIPPVLQVSLGYSFKF
jgi:hypothetical protein